MAYIICATARPGAGQRICSGSVLTDGLQYVERYELLGALCFEFTSSSQFETLVECSTKFPADVTRALPESAGIAAMPDITAQFMEFEHPPDSLRFFGFISKQIEKDHSSREAFLVPGCRPGLAIISSRLFEELTDSMVLHPQEVDIYFQKGKLVFYHPEFIPMVCPFPVNLGERLNREHAQTLLEVERPPHLRPSIF